MVLLQANSLQQSSLSLSDGFELTNADLIIRNNRKAYGIVAMLFVTSVLLLISSLIYFNGENKGRVFECKCNLLPQSLPLLFVA